MSLALLEQNAQILSELARNYESLLEKKKQLKKTEQETYEMMLRKFKTQFLYVLTGLHKLVEEEKNVR